MNEIFLGTVPALGVVACIVGAIFYMLGGRSGKWRRRFLGSLFCSTAVWAEALLLGNFNPLMLAIYPLLIFAFCLGYGSDVPLEKIEKRMVIVVLVLLASLLMVLIMGGGSAFYIYWAHWGIALMSIILGVKNPLYAAPEEFFICMMLTAPLAMYPFLK